MRVTSKGRVTIPKYIRDKAGLLPNTEVEFTLVKGRIILRASGKPTTSGKAPVNGLRGSLKHLNKNADKLMAITRGGI